MKKEEDEGGVYKSGVGQGKNFKGIRNFGNIF